MGEFPNKEFVGSYVLLQNGQYELFKITPQQMRSVAKAKHIDTLLHDTDVPEIYVSTDPFLVVNKLFGKDVSSYKVPDYKTVTSYLKNNCAKDYNVQIIPLAPIEVLRKEKLN